MSLLPEVWVWLSRTHDGRLHAALPEALYEAGALARRLGVPLVGIADALPGEPEQELLRAGRVEDLRFDPGAVLPHPLVAGGTPPFAALDGVPRAFILLADPFGAVAAPLFAAAHKAALVTHATSVTSDGRRFLAARPMLGGQAEALVSAPLEAPLVVTLQPGAVGDAAPPHVGSAFMQDAPLSALVHPPDATTLAVSDAERIVAFGRGAFSHEAIALVARLAALLGAAVAGTRPAADEGWLPFARQVGLTGAMVAPRLYVAVGISGAPYHMAGVKDPETLIAINSDPEAPIFAAAHLGIVGDLHAVLPVLIGGLERGEPIEAAALVAARGAPGSGTLAGTVAGAAAAPSAAAPSAEHNVGRNAPPTPGRGAPR